MDDERVAAGGDDALGQQPKSCFRVLFVDACAALDCHQDRDPRLDGGNAIADEVWFSHQTRAKSTALDPLGRTADVEIYFVIAKISANLRRRRQFSRIGTAKLHGNEMLPALSPSRRWRSPWRTAAVAN